MLLFLFCIGINNSSNAQLPSLDWVKQFRANNWGNGSSIVSLKLDTVKNIISSGYFMGSTDFNPSTNPGDTFVLQSSPNGSPALFVSKLDSMGNFIWAKRIWGSVSPNQVSSVSTDNFGSVYVTGSFSDTGHFDNITVLAHPSPGYLAPLSDGFVSKLDVQGNFVWVRQIGGASADYATSIASDPTSSGLIVTGTFYDTVQINTITGPVTLINTNVDNQSVFICKLDTSGNFLWAKQLGGDSGSLAYPSLCLDAQGNILLAGTFGGTVDFDPGIGAVNLSGSGMFVCKLNPQGGFYWAKAAQGLTDGGFPYPPAITVDREGSVYTTGNFAHRVDFDPGQDTADLYATHPYGSDIFVCKWNASGDFEWVKGFNRTTADSLWNGIGNTGNAISVDYAGNVFTAGHFSGIVDFNPGLNADDTFILQTSSFYNGYISKLDPQGNFLWNFQLKTSGSSICNAIYVDKSGAIYHAGDSYGSVNFDPNGTYNLTETGAYISKLRDTNVNNGIPGLHKIAEGILLYPNPAGSEIWLKNDAGAAMQSLAVYNMLGQAMVQEKVKGQTLYRLDVHHWASGLYFVKVALANGKVMQGKFEIQR